MGVGSSKNVAAIVRQPDLGEESPSAAHAQPVDEVEMLKQLRSKQVEGSFARILGKMGVAGTAGLVLGPILFPPVARSPALTGVLTAANCAAVVGFFDLARESLTALMIVDTPMTSLFAGSLTGYVLNGIVHQSKPRAIAGAMVAGSLATVLHTVLPNFHLNKTITQALLAAELIDDPDGRIHAEAMAPPTLPALTWYKSFAWVERFVLSYLPVRKVSDEEFEEMERVNPPLRLSFRKDPKQE